MGTRVEHSVLGRGTVVPSEVEGTAVQYDGGALVEYPGQSIGSSGHRRCLDRLDFGAALSALKSGEHVARTGWNGKGMWLALVEPLHPAERSNHGDPSLSADLTDRTRKRHEQLGRQISVYTVGLDVSVPEHVKVPPESGAIVSARDWLYATSTPGSGCRALPWIGMKTADNGFVPWLASQTDMLAEDWEVIEDARG